MSHRFTLDWRFVGITFLGMSLSFVGTRPSFAQEPAPLHQRIDQLVQQSAVGVASPPASDADFIRRAYLDITGRIPPVADVRAFLADANPNKRQALIDALLASPQCNQRLAEWLDVSLMERRTEAQIPPAEWRKYLVDSVAANKPFDQLAREILSADGVDPALRPAVKFYLDRNGEPNLLTRDVGRMFFGVDLQCAQCHDHPLISDYLQSDYYGVFAYLLRGVVFTEKDGKKLGYYAEKADGEAKFTSVFTKEAGLTGPRLPSGGTLQEPPFAKGDEYQVAPADNVRPVPKFSRRAEMAKQATSGANRAFNRNIANRVWALMLGRGLVEPVDLHHSGNPPTHPALLELLTDEIVARKFDLKSMMREIALSQTYQRGLELAPNLPESAASAAAQLAQLEAQQTQLEAAAKTALDALEKAREARVAAEKTLLPVHEELTKAQAAETVAFDASKKAAAALAAAQKMLADKQDVANVITAAAMKTKEAAGKLPDDKELAAAAEKFQARATQLATEVAALTKSANDLAAPAKTVGDALVAARQATAAVQTKLAEQSKPVEPLRQQVADLDAKYKATEYAARLAAQRVAETKALQQFATLAASLKSSQAAVAQLQADLAAKRQSVTTLAAELPKRQAEMAEAQKQRDEAAAQLAQTQQQVAKHEDARKAVAEAAAQAEAAKQKLPNDAELAAAAQQFKTRGEQLTAAAAELQKTLTAKTEAANVAGTRFTTLNQAVAKMTADITAMQAQIPPVEAQLPALQAKVAADDGALATVQQDVIQRWSQRAYAAGLRPLAPEQLAWSMMQATGVLAPQYAAAEAELAKTAPLTDAIKADAKQMAARAQQIEQLVVAKVQGNINAFVSLFAAGAGQPQNDFFATVDQALFFANGGTVLSWLGAGGDNLAARLLKLEDPQQFADELYLSILSRPASPAEKNDVAQYLAARPKEKPAAIQQLAWALLTSAEFRFNH